MTGLTFRDDFERLVVDWLAETAGTPAPDYLDEALGRIEHVRQRPAWMSPGRWLPMRALTLRRIEIPRFLPYLVALALVFLIAIAIVIAAGSARRLPPPFGLAATGSFVYDSGGDLFLASADGVANRLTDTPDIRESGAVWSRDGTRLAFAAAAAGSPHPSLWVMNADGSGARLVSGDLELESSSTLPLASWSPDGLHLLFWADLRLYVVDTDGANLRQLTDDSVQAVDPSWSPRGDLIAFNGVESPTAGLAVYVIAADGGEVTKVSEAQAGPLPPWPEWAPDGLRLAYHAGSANSDVFVATLDGSTWTERPVVTGPTVDSWPAWSNDGTHLSFVRSAVSDHGWIVVANADGSGQRRVTSGTIAWSPHCWTPDDRSIIAPTAEENVAIGQEDRPGFVILSVDGSRAPITISTPRRQAFAACSWQRLAP